MKKVIHGIAALLAITGMAATPQTNMQAQSPTKTINRNMDAIDKTIAPAAVEDLRELHSSGSFMDNRCLSPKEYGQMLQANRRQKWVKSNKHKSR